MTLGVTGEVDINVPGWIDVEFGFDPLVAHGPGTWSADVSIDRIDKVFDAKHPGKLIDPPRDLAAWVAKLPGVTVIAPPKRIKIDGLDATQLDVRSGAKDVRFGPISPESVPNEVDPPTAFGFGPHQSRRIVAVSVDGHAVLIVVGMVEAPETHGRFEAATKALQPLIDSIVWH